MNPARHVASLVTLLLIAGCGDATDPDRNRAPDADWQVVATSAGERKIAAIKAIREVTGLGLKDAKELADTVPSIIVSAVPEVEAQAVANRLRGAGMTVQIRPE